ncbi:alpha-L-fucosidase [Sphingobacterium prati]|uniref:alpha-L-fucosidase n=1 Tax=Sphingobacterium prati TaxID=2737006 RepID=UPI001FE857F6|nr:alpha-L-fucosidase [Sphingobacterium prati]
MKTKLKMYKILFLILLISGISSGASMAQENKLPDSLRMKWWEEARFGMFIHWGVYAQFGGVYRGHEQARGGAEWIMNRSKIPVDEYQAMAGQFNPVQYNPDEWVRIAKDAGMKYLIITAKHHDGFALFETKTSKWNMVDATPYGKDLLKPLAAACKKYGVKLGFYYSQAQDWNNPGGSAARKLMREGWPSPDSAKIDAYTLAHKGHWDPKQETASFDDYIKNVSVPQVKELLSNYGDISVLWWDTPTNMTDEAASMLQEQLRLQPNIITNDRLKRPNFPGDTKTPEQKIPDWSELEGKHWETCMTMNGTWGFRTSDHKWKSAETLIRNLVDIASKGGNYLLNVGPKPDGSFPQESIDRLATIGKWMKINSEAIYATKSSPLQPFEWGRCTMKELGDKTLLYLTIFDWPQDGTVVLPVKNKVLNASFLSNGKTLKVKSQSDTIKIDVSKQAIDPVATVIKIELDGKLERDKTATAKEMKTGALDE